MDLEQRVNVLEQEMQILKNQIQATLLDIQEYILTNKHSTLRADQAPAPVAVNNTRPIQQAAAGPSPVAQDDSAPIVRRVSLSDLDSEDQEADFLPKARAPRPAAPRSGHSVGYGKLEAWADQKVQEVGVVRTRQMIDSYAAEGRISPEAAESLLARLPWEEPTRPRRAETLPPAPQPVVRAAHPRPQQTTSSRQAEATTPARPPAQRQTAAVQAPARQIENHTEASAEDDEDMSHNVVLKLIAGVANAGIGGWRKKNG